MIEIRGVVRQAKVGAFVLWPLKIEDARLLAEHLGEEFRAVLTQNKGRSISQLALFWVLCGHLAENLESDPPITKEMVATVLKIETGHADVVKFADGTYRHQPRSIAFNSMSPEEFGAFLDRALTVASLKFGPALTVAARKELERIGS